MENVNLMFTLPNLQGLCSFPWLELIKTHFALCLHVALCSVTKSFQFQLWMNLLRSFHFASLNTVETKARNLSKIRTGAPVQNIYEQHFVYSIFYCPYSGEEESSSSSSSSSSLKEHGVSPRDSE